MHCSRLTLYQQENSKESTNVGFIAPFNKVVPIHKPEGFVCFVFVWDDTGFPRVSLDSRDKQRVLPVGQVPLVLLSLSWKSVGRNSGHGLDICQWLGYC